MTLMEEVSTNISVQDIELVIRIIDICSSRGAFRGEELMTIGQLREKFNDFLKKTEESNKKSE